MNIRMLKWTFIFVVLFMTYSDSCKAESELANQERFFRSIPKAELHLHLGGAYPLDFLLDMASPQQATKLMENLELIAQGISYQSVFQVFSVISQIVNTEEKVQLGTYALCRSLEADGVTYAEIRTGLKDFGNGLESYLQSVLQGIEKAESNRFKGCLLLSLQRSSTAEFAKKTIDLALLYKDKGVIGIDISGDSTIGNIDAILPEILRAKEGGLFLTVHMGESPLEKDQKRILDVLRPDRIGHGVHLSPGAIEWILENRTPVEVCLTSSFLVQMTNEYAAHPWLKHHLKGHPIVICTDDPLIFCTTLSKELQLLHELSIFNREKIEEIVQDSFQYAFKRLSSNGEDHDIESF